MFRLRRYLSAAFLVVVFFAAVFLAVVFLAPVFFVAVVFFAVLALVAVLRPRAGFFSLVGQSMFTQLRRGPRAVLTTPMGAPPSAQVSQSSVLST